MTPHDNIHVVSEEEQRRKRQQLRGVEPKPPEGGYWGVHPIFPMPGVDEGAAPVTPEEWLRRPVAPPHRTPIKGGWKRPPRGTLSWSHPARAAAMAELRRLQFPTDCDTAKILAVGTAVQTKNPVNHSLEATWFKLYA
jgi:hypothetical protein